MNNFREYLENLKTLAIVCYQWGDTGKGKFVDILAEWADIIARGTGGDNAGHTISINGRKHIFHLIPSGILWDREGKTNLIGSGVVFNPRVAVEERRILEEEGKSFDNLLISLNAKLILPQHILLDRAKESDSGSGRIGTTGRGIGPAYTDHYARLGLVVNDMLNPDIFASKLKRNLKDKIKLLKLADPVLIKEIMSQPFLENGLFYKPDNIFDMDAIVDQYVGYGKYFKSIIFDTDNFMRSVIGRKKVLLEGAQGLFLSIDKGSYPYVTSSDCSEQGLARGVGIRDSDIDMTLGIVKAFYMTRVGGGPFPTEIGGKKSEEWCGKADVAKKMEAELFKEATVNSRDEFIQGIGIRIAGDEYGATTSRPRRTGWLDLPMLRYAVNVSGPNVIFTKIDVLNQCEEIKICKSYIYKGPNYQLGQKIIKTGSIIDMAIPSSEVMSYCEPLYENFPGWMSDLKSAKSYMDLPEKLKSILDYVKNKAFVSPKILSIGADREKTIFL